MQLFEKKGEGRGRAAQGQGPRPGLTEGQSAGQAGTEGRAGCKIPFSGFQGLKTSKSRFCNFLRKGKGGAGQHRARAKARAKGRAGAGQAGRRQGAGAGHRGQGRVARFHLEVSRPQNHVLQLFEKEGEGRGRAAQARARPGLREGRVQGRQGAGRVQGQGTEGRA